MREAVLADFFMGRVTARELADDVTESTEIEDTSAPFLVTRDMAIALCDAVLREELPPECLEIIGFALIASDNFYWTEGDDEPAETFYDWSAPEINHALTLENVHMFRSRLIAKRVG